MKPGSSSPEGAGPSTLLSWRAGSEQLTVEVRAPEAVAPLEALFPDDRAHRPSHPPELTLERTAEGYHLTVPSGSLTAPDLAAALTRLELALAEALVRRGGRPGLHAGGVVLGGGALLFAGEGGAGKSSLTAALGMTGAPVLGDDVVLLSPDGRIGAFRRLLKVEEPARTILGLPERRGPLAELWPDAAFYHPSELGTTWADPAPLRWIVFPRRGTGAPPMLVERRPAEVLPRMLAGLVLTDRVHPQAFDAVVHALDGARCAELRYDETAPAAALLRSELG